MKKMKQILALVLTFLMITTSIVMASESTNEADFSYGINAAFRSRDLIEGYVLLTGTPGTEGDIKTICYLPIYYENSSKLADIFVIPISIENAFSQGEGTSGYILIPFEIRVTDPAITNYRLKAIMVDSSENLQPRGKISSGFTNEISLSNTYYPIFVEFDTLIKKVPLQRNQTTLAIPILDHVYLWEGAIEKGYTEEDFTVGESITLTDVDMNDFYDVQGLYCRIRIDLSNDGGYKLQQIEPLKNYNKTVAIKPINLINAKNNNNQAEYYASNATEEASYLPLAESVTVYKNYGIASFDDVVPDKSNYITEYRYVDTNMDGLYETVYIDYEEVFLIGSIMLSSYRIVPDFDSMRTYNSGSLVLSPDDFYTNYDINIPFGVLNPGQIVRLKQSYDADCTFYKVNVQDPKTVIGEVTNVVASSEGIRYTIGDTDYRMLLDNGYPSMEVGDMVEIKGFDDVIVNYQFVFNANVGIILDSDIVDGFDTTYQIKLLNTDGEVIVYNLADKVNGYTPNYSTSSILQNSFPSGSIFTYYLNDNNEICTYDLQGNYFNNTLKNGEKVTSANGKFTRDSGKLGSYTITKDTIFFAADCVQTDILEGNVMLSDASVLNENANYNFGILYDAEKNAMAVILYAVSFEESEEILSDISYGVVTGCSYSETFESVCTLQILNQNGNTVSYCLSSVLNREKTDYSDAAALAAEFPKGELIAYRINDKNEIKMVDTLSGIHSGNVLQNTQLITIDCTYQNEAFDDYKVTDSTVLTGTEAKNGADISKDNCTLVTQSDFADGDQYKGVGVINDKNELLFIFTYNTVSAVIDPDSYPIIITKSVTLNDGTVQYWGYVNGEDVVFRVADNASDEAKKLTNGDVALYTTNRDGEITGVLVLAKKEEDGFIVLDNAINGAKDDAFKESNANKTFLSTKDYIYPSNASQAKAIAETMISTEESDIQLAGFGAAGKGYSFRGNLLRLINAKDYAETFTSDERDYTDSYDEDKIHDYEIYPRESVAYLYDATNDKIQVCSLLNMETDNNTLDYWYSRQIENDDAVYVYNYDGETKLILIVDIMGDNL